MPYKNVKSLPYALISPDAILSSRSNVFSVNDVLVIDSDNGRKSTQHVF